MYKETTAFQFLRSKSDQLIYNLIDCKLKLTFFILVFSPCIVNSNIKGTNNMHTKSNKLVHLNC